MRRLAAVLVAPLLLLAVAGCRDNSGGAPAPGVDRPRTSAQNQVGSMESTLDSIESELNAG
jgi:hypothetical protein